MPAPPRPKRACRHRRAFQLVTRALGGRQPLMAALSCSARPQRLQHLAVAAARASAPPPTGRHGAPLAATVAAAGQQLADSHHRLCGSGCRQRRSRTITTSSSSGSNSRPARQGISPAARCDWAPHQPCCCFNVARCRLSAVHPGCSSALLAASWCRVPVPARRQAVLPLHPSRRAYTSR